MSFTTRIKVISRMSRLRENIFNAFSRRYACSEDKAVHRCASRIDINACGPRRSYWIVWRKRRALIQSVAAAITNRIVVWVAMTRSLPPFSMMLRSRAAK